MSIPTHILPCRVVFVATAVSVAVRLLFIGAVFPAQRAAYLTHSSPCTNKRKERLTTLRHRLN